MKRLTMQQIMDKTKKRRAKWLLQFERSNCTRALFARKKKVSSSYIGMELAKAKEGRGKK